MTVVVKNELTDPWVFDGSAGKRRVEPGQVSVISDEEWNDVISAKRGPGGLNALWPNEATSDSNALKFDYYLVGADYEIRHLGFSQQGVLISVPEWTVKRFEHTTLGGENLVSGIQVLGGVAWDDRATLPWT